MRQPAIAVINAGSSSLKFALYRPDGAALQQLCHGQMTEIAHRGRFTVQGVTPQFTIDEEVVLADHGAALQRLLGWLDGHDDVRLSGVGHRVVHGGVGFAAPVVVDEDVVERLQALIPLAPLHQPHNLKAIELLRQLRPDLPQVACFDTAFHRTMPETAQRYALPPQFFDDGVRAYGFHGLSYEYIVSVMPRYLGESARGRVIVAHLGNGASMCALHDGRSVATTMGFTPLDGMPMGTRCGAIDPGVLIHLLRQGMAVDALDELLQHHSGLLGLSGISSDMRTLLSSRDRHAAEAVEQFCYRASREIGSLAAALGGVDAIIFTGGIGEHAAAVRETICHKSHWLGVALESSANQRHSSCITTTSSGVSVWVIATDEEQIIARHCHRLVMGP